MPRPPRTRVVGIARRRIGEAARDVVQVRQRLPGEAGRLGLECDELRVEPGAPVRLGHLGREAVAQRDRVIAEAGRGAELLDVDGALRSAGPK